MRISDKIQQIHSFLDELVDAVPQTVEEYKSDNITRAACERFVEKVVEAVTDLAFLVITHRKFRIPDDDVDAFAILQENSIIDQDLATKLKQAKGMRNFIAHQYGKINDELVYEALTQHIEQDVREFITCVEKKVVKNR